MKEYNDWNTFEELSDVDQLLSSGAQAEESAYSLDDIMQEFGGVATEEKTVEAVEAPAEETAPEAPAVQEEVPEEPAYSLDDIMQEFDGVAAAEEAAEAVEEPAPVEQPAQESVPEAPSGEPEGDVEAILETFLNEGAPAKQEPKKSEDTIRFFPGKLLRAVRQMAKPAPEAIQEPEESVESQPEEQPAQPEPMEVPVELPQPEEIPVEEELPEPEERPAEEVVSEPEELPEEHSEPAETPEAEVIPEEGTAPEAEEAPEEVPETTEETGETEPIDPEFTLNPQEEDSGVDMADTADFISQFVSDVMGPEEEEADTGNPFVGVLTDFRRKAAEHRLRKEQEKRERAAEAAAAAKAAREAERAADKVVEMPVSRLKPIRDTVGAIQDKAHNFADNMWTEAAGPTEEEQISDEYIPGTDEEKTVSRPRRTRERKPRIPLKTFPDTDAVRLAKRYRFGLNKMGKRTIAAAVVTALMLYFNVAPGTELPLGDVLAQYSRYVAAGLTWGLAMVAAIGLDVLWMGFTAPKRGRPGMHTITSVAVIATMLDGIYYAAIGREGPLPFCAMAAFGLVCAMWGTYSRKRALFLACRAAAVAREPYRVTLDDNKWDGKASFAREAGSKEGFGSQIQSLDGAERIYRLFVPVLLIAGVLCAVLASVGRGKPGLLLWCLSAIMVAGAPASGMLAFGLPYLRLTNRLDRSGAVIAGWDGVEAMSGQANILIKDEDLFPAGSITLNSTTSFHETSIEKLAGCTASMLRGAGSGLYHLFDDEIRRQGGFYRRVDELECYEAGGMTATIRGESVMIGTYGFMTVMRVPLDKGLKLEKAVFCVIDNRLEGLFGLDYDLSPYARTSIEALIRAGVHPVLVTRDFNVTPEMLRNFFDLPDDQMEYPPIRRRKEMSEPDQVHNPVVGALLTRGGMGAYSDAIIGGRRLRRVVNVNAILTVLASILGMVLAFFLTSVLAFASLTPMNMLVFLVIWLLPTLVNSGGVDRF